VALHAKIDNKLEALKIQKSETSTLLMGLRDEQEEKRQ
jgi:hypothetical protein